MSHHLSQATNRRDRGPPPQACCRPSPLHHSRVPCSTQDSAVTAKPFLGGTARSLLNPAPQSSRPNAASWANARLWGAPRWQARSQLHQLRRTNADALQQPIKLSSFHFQSNGLLRPYQVSLKTRATEPRTSPCGPCAPRAQLPTDMWIELPGLTLPASWMQQPCCLGEPASRDSAPFPYQRQPPCNISNSCPQAHICCGQRAKLAWKGLRNHGRGIRKCIGKVSHHRPNIFVNKDQACHTRRRNPISVFGRTYNHICRPSSARPQTERSESHWQLRSVSEHSPTSVSHIPRPTDFFIGLQPKGELYPYPPLTASANRTLNQETRTCNRGATIPTTCPDTRWAERHERAPFEHDMSLVPNARCSTPATRMQRAAASPHGFLPHIPHIGRQCLRSKRSTWSPTQSPTSQRRGPLPASACDIAGARCW